MISIELIRNQTQSVLSALQKRGEEFPLSEILELDTRRRQANHQADQLRAQRKESGKGIARMPNIPDDVRLKMRGVSEEIDRLDKSVEELERQLRTLLLELPNMPLEEVAPGSSEQENVVVLQSGEISEPAFEPIPHWDLGERLGIIDFKRGARMSGSRFYILTGKGAKLERALINWMLDVHVEEHGYQEIYSPALVKQEIMEGSGNLPKFADNLYRDEEADLWLIPTAEVPLTGMHRDEIFEPGTLPVHYTAYTPCFRREKAAAGKDTRGIKRVHQFDKVEMYKFVEPETSPDELEGLLEDAKDICKRLDLPYRVLSLCAGEMGFASAKSYDIEVWARGSKEWLEVSSCSNCTDFQARRSNIRYRGSVSGKPMYVHTLNGSGLALPRIMIAIMENYQNSDGSVNIPDVLIPYTGFSIIRPI